MVANSNKNGSTHLKGESNLISEVGFVKNNVSTEVVPTMDFDAIKNVASKNEELNKYQPSLFGVVSS